MIRLLITIVFLSYSSLMFAQTDTLKEILNVTPLELTNLEELLNSDEEESAKKEFVRYAFKSTRVVMGQSMEMLGKGVLDFRILHRFGMLKGGISEFFGLDQATMRMSFDYGISKNLSIGIGRSTFGKELDGFFKWRLAHQHTKVKPVPVSLIWVSGITCKTVYADPQIQNYFTNRLGYFHQIIIGRKFSDGFTLQLSPTTIHRNMVELVTDKNDTYALGIGSRMKITKRTSFMIDSYLLLSGFRKNVNEFPLSIGLDVETGGHVFQVHISNARGMNEKAFITETTQNWVEGQINIGFNLSRVFTIKKNEQSNY